MGFKENNLKNNIYFLEKFIVKERLREGCVGIYLYLYNFLGD